MVWRIIIKTLLTENIMKVFYILILFGIAKSWSTEKKCMSRNLSNEAIVCVCNENHCDTLEKVKPIQTGKYITYTSSKAGLRFSRNIYDIDDKAHFENKINIDGDRKYQTMFGWGGAFTDSTGINILSLPQKAQELLMRSYFGDDGLEYNLGRVPIGGTDFSTEGYSYADNDDKPDPNLETFTLKSADIEYKIPFIKQALQLNADIKFIAAAWTAPKWMKTNNDYTGLGSIKTEYYQTWADYHLKFLQSYDSQGIEFWGISTGNEPSLSIIPFNKINTVGWTPPDMLEWIVKYMGPTIRNSSFSEIKIFTLDDQRIILPAYIGAINSYKEVLNYLDGIGVHWYWDSTLSANYLTKFHNLFPEKFILATEACSGYILWEKHVDLGSWKRAQDYANSIIEDTNNWSIGWVDWNMALNLEGGPTYIQNFVDSPIIVNSTSAEFYKQPMYYALSHFSKFIPRDSIKISSTQFDIDVPNVAFKRPDNGTVVVILNKLYEVVQISIEDKNRGFMNIELPENSITSVIYW